jgi:hypothetical protein
MVMTYKPISFSNVLTIIENHFPIKCNLEKKKIDSKALIISYNCTCIFNPCAFNKLQTKIWIKSLWIVIMHTNFSNTIKFNSFHH